MKSTTNNYNNIAHTPRKIEKQSLNDNTSVFNLAFDSPFDRCVFEQSSRTKQLNETPTTRRGSDK